MPGHDIIVIGASSGGIEALVEVVSRLPEDIPAAMFIVVHVTPRSVSVLPDILNRAGPLTAAHAKNNETIKAGRIYVAPPDFHMLIDDGTIRLVRGPKENNTRPAIDPTFRTAARAYGPRVVGVVLSGALDDGTAGLHAVKKRRGVAIVQDPAEALFPDMPQNAIAGVAVDHVLPKAEIAPLLARLAREPASPNGGRAPETMEKEIEIEAMNMKIPDDDKPGEPSVYGCPECGGVLWELQEDELLRFRCRVGHGYSAEGLIVEQSEALDTALWSAYRALQENASLARRLAERAKENKQREFLIDRFEQRARSAAEQAQRSKSSC
ncbi:MAG TPA: chemotaxis protein CheB [Verrucomicrobiae bacterium]|nr:chemotaxis protein CheB [Verrucomicrobiae bacterium]